MGAAPFSSRGISDALIMKLLFAICLLCLAACDQSRLTHYKEWQCLDSEKLNFVDPTSVRFVANLGSRGIDVAGGRGMWVRYIAKNAFGANGQGNILCIETSKGWRRHQLGERLAVLHVSVTLLEIKKNEVEEELRKKNEGLPWDEEVFSKRPDFEREAKQIVFDGAGDLSRYQRPREP